MKKGTYTLIFEYDDGGTASRGDLTKDECHKILSGYQEQGWYHAPSDSDQTGRYIKRWQVGGPWEETRNKA